MVWVGFIHEHDFVNLSHCDQAWPGSLCLCYFTDMRSQEGRSVCLRRIMPDMKDNLEKSCRVRNSQIARSHEWYPIVGPGHLDPVIAEVTLLHNPVHSHCDAMTAQ